MARISYAYAKVMETYSHCLPTIDSLLDELKKIDNEMGSLLLLLDQINIRSMD